MSEHIVRAYDEELASLKTMLAQMGGLAEDQLAKAIDSLAKRDTILADQVIAQDEKVDALELNIEEKAILTIARRQPMARDLRDIMVAIRISSDLERIGDLAKNVAKRVHAIPDAPPRKLSSGLTRMGRLALEQLITVLDAYATMSDEKALEVWRSDEELDALYNSIFRFDDEMIVTPHLFRAHGYQHPALLIRRLSPHGVFDSFAEQFQQVWDGTRPVHTMELAVG